MIRKLFCLLFLAIPGHAYVHLTGAWAGNGEAKIAQQNYYPFGGCSSCTVTRNWDGTNIKVFGLRNESIGWALWALNSSGVNATGVSVALSPLTGTLGGVISSTAVLCSQTTSYVNRPFQMFVSTYVPILGMTEGSWAAPPYEERDLPQAFRNACTVNANNDCIANTASWAGRPDANKYYPTGLFPQECVSGGVTVSSGTSQLFWTDLYIDKTVAADTYTATMTIYEGATVSSSIPVKLLVYGATLPDKPAIMVLADVSEDDVNFRHHAIAHGTQCVTATCVKTRNAYYSALHHEGITTVGDVPDVSTNDFPSVEYQNQLSGSNFTAANGYYGRGVNTGAPFYSVGTYASINNNPSFSGTNTAIFCQVVSSWSAYFANNYPSVKAINYWADEPVDFTLTNKYSTWASTVPACTVNGKLNGWVTGKYPDINANAPYINSPASTNFNETGSSIANWATLVSSYATSPSMVFGYNGHPSWSGTMYSTEDGGMSAMEPIIAAKNKGMTGWFMWQTTNWYNPGNQTPAENCLWNGACANPAKTFGYDVYPATDPVKGRYGFNYGNGDGVLMYPGTDTAFPGQSLGIDGPIEDLRLKYVRAGINLADYAALASSVDSTATTAILNTLLGNQLWEVGCFTGADCTYQYGGRQWSQDPNTWETARESLAVLAVAGSAPTSSASASFSARGGARFSNVKFR